MNHLTLCQRCGQPTCRECATCGEMECDHHSFVPVGRPVNCVCAAGEWRDPENIPQACPEHQGDPEQNCLRCEHDLECHKYI